MSSVVYVEKLLLAVCVCLRKFAAKLKRREIDAYFSDISVIKDVDVIECSTTISSALPVLASIVRPGNFSYRLEQFNQMIEHQTLRDFSGTPIVSTEIALAKAANSMTEVLLTAFDVFSHASSAKKRLFDNAPQDAPSPKRVRISKVTKGNNLCVQVLYYGLVGHLKYLETLDVPQNEFMVEWNQLCTFVNRVSLICPCSLIHIYSSFEDGFVFSSNSSSFQTSYNTIPQSVLHLTPTTENMARTLFQDIPDIPGNSWRSVFYSKLPTFYRKKIVWYLMSKGVNPTEYIPTIDMYPPPDDCKDKRNWMFLLSFKNRAFPELSIPEILKDPFDAPMLSLESSTLLSSLIDIDPPVFEETIHPLDSIVASFLEMICLKYSNILSSLLGIRESSTSNHRNSFSEDFHPTVEYDEIYHILYTFVKGKISKFFEILLRIVSDQM